MLTVEFTVEPYLSGVRIDSFLGKHLRNYTAWRLHRMVAAGLAHVDDMPADPLQRVFRGQRVRFRAVEPPDKLLPPSNQTLAVVYEDPWLIVIDKPPGMVVHPVGDFQRGTLTNALQAHFDRQTTVPGLLRPGVVHRLDRMTSGLMVVTREHQAHRLLSLEFQHGRLVKSYVALVEGCVPFDQRIIDLPIGQRAGGRSILMSAGADACRRRSARTKVTVLERRRHISLVACRLYTGRNHQIRVHLAEIGHPVLGDEFYGPHGRIREASDRLESSATARHALHAALLEFRHPILGAGFAFVSPPPADFCTASVPLPV